MDAGEQLMKNEPVDFYINQRPISISFECPHCLMDVDIDWGDVDVPDSWSDDRPWIETKCCKSS